MEGNRFSFSRCANLFESKKVLILPRQTRTATEKAWRRTTKREIQFCVLCLCFLPPFHTCVISLQTGLRVRASLVVLAATVFPMRIAITALVGILRGAIWLDSYRRCR